MNAREIQERLSQFDAFEGDVDDVLSAFLLLQFEMMEPERAFVQANLLTYLEELRSYPDAPLRRLFSTLWERGLIRRDIDLPDLVMAFQSVNLGLIAGWVLGSSSFAPAAKGIRIQMKLLSEGLKAGEAYEV